MNIFRLLSPIKQEGTTFVAMMTVVFSNMAIGAPPEKDDPRITPTVKAVSRVLPSVVNIGTEKIISTGASPWNGSDPFEKMLRDFFNQQAGVKTLSLGSGAVIARGGLIVTNAHVVHRATKIIVRTSDGKNHLAREVASDQLNDLALLQLLDADSVNLPPIPLAKPDSLMLGETVIAVGNPFGLGNSISRGVLSATQREVSYRGKVIFSDILQTDAAINPGNSGGPLINIKGEMIGINTAIFEAADGIGFAVPIKRVENVLAKWLIPERFRDVSLGIVPAVEDENDKVTFKIQTVFPESPAWDAGLRAGNIITAVNGAPPKNVLAVGETLWRLDSGDKVALDVAERGRVVLKVRAIKVLDGEKLARNRLGLGLHILTPKLAVAMGYPFHGGLVVSKVLFPSDTIKRGDVLVRVNGNPVYDFKSLRRALANKRNGDRVTLFFVILEQQGGNIAISRNIVPLTLK